MIKIRPPRTTADLTSSLVGSSFRRVYRDGRVTDHRRIMTLRQILSQPRNSTEPRR